MWFGWQSLQPRDSRTLKLFVGKMSGEYKAFEIRSMQFSLPKALKTQFLYLNSLT